MIVNNDSITINNIPLHNYSFRDAVKKIITKASGDERENCCVSLTGAHGLVYARKHPEFEELLHSFYLNLPDGMPGVWLGRMKGARLMQRCYGPNIFAAIMKASSTRNIKHFLCGGKEGVAEKLKVACAKKFNNTNITGTYCPPFLGIDEYDYEMIAEKINRSGADIVWIGISTPKQEQFAWRLSHYTNTHFLITVGAAFDFHTGSVPQAPGLMQQLGLEWFFRLMMEPRRLAKRYMEIVPLFMYYSVLDLWKYKFNKDS